MIKTFKKFKKVIALTLAMAFLVQTVLADTLTVSAATAASSSNIHNEDQTANWADTVKSYLISNDDGTYTRVEYVSGKITVETYDSTTFKLKSKKSLKMELPLFGGFYAGEDYNYFVFGQENPKESDKVEVYRIVQYTKKWKRVTSAGLYGANTYIPFEAGSLRMCEYENYIYVRTCHEMYQSSDGYHHQANVTFSFNEKTGKITDSFTGIMNLAYCGYVSHSFNQFIQVDTDGSILAVDHGDAYPRSIVLSQYADKAGSDSFISSCDSVDIKSFSGATGNNYTNASVGGFEITKSSYLVAYEYDGNIYLGSVSKSKFSSSGLTTKKLTSNKSSSETRACTPMLIKVSSDQYVVMWETAKSWNHTGKIKYVVVNAKGKKTGSVQTLNGSLSDCKPIAVGKKLVWYVTDSSKPVFYWINLKSGKIAKKKTK